MTSIVNRVFNTTVLKRKSVRHIRERLVDYINKYQRDCLIDGERLCKKNGDLIFEIKRHNHDVVLFASSIRAMCFILNKTVDADFIYCMGLNKIETTIHMIKTGMLTSGQNKQYYMHMLTIMKERGAVVEAIINHDVMRLVFICQGIRITVDIHAHFTDSLSSIYTTYTVKTHEIHMIKLDNQFCNSIVNILKSDNRVMLDDNKLFRLYTFIVRNFIANMYAMCSIKSSYIILLRINHEMSSEKNKDICDCERIKYIASVEKNNKVLFKIIITKCDNFNSTYEIVDEGGLMSK